jgi:hypothetical protein
MTLESGEWEVEREGEEQCSVHVNNYMFPELE